MHQSGGESGGKDGLYPVAFDGELETSCLDERGCVRTAGKSGVRGLCSTAGNVRNAGVKRSEVSVGSYTEYPIFWPLFIMCLFFAAQVLLLETALCLVSVILVMPLTVQPHPPTLPPWYHQPRSLTYQPCLHDHRQLRAAGRMLHALGHRTPGGPLGHSGLEMDVTDETFTLCFLRP